MMRAAWGRYKYKVLTRDINVLTVLAIVAIHPWHIRRKEQDIAREKPPKQKNDDVNKGGKAKTIERTMGHAVKKDSAPSPSATPCRRQASQDWQTWSKTAFAGTDQNRIEQMSRLHGNERSKVSVNQRTSSRS